MLAVVCTLCLVPFILCTNRNDNYQTHAKIPFTFSAIIGVTYWAETTLDREFTITSDSAGALFGRNTTAFETYVNAQRIRYKTRVQVRGGAKTLPDFLSNIII